jgi:hypothetical protein
MSVMKKIVFLLSSIFSTLCLSAQQDNNVTLMHLDTTREYVMKIEPIVYTNPDCQSFSLKVKFTYNQYNETIKAIISCPDSAKYDLIWKTNENIYIKGGKIRNLKDHFKKKGQKIALSTHFKTQVKDQGIDVVDQISCKNCNLQSCSTGRSKFNNPKLTNEIFYLKNLDLQLIFKVANNSNPEICFNAIIPVKFKNGLFSNNKKLALQYIAQGPIFKFFLKRDPCVEESNGIGKDLIVKIGKMESDYKAIAEARNMQDRTRFLQLKERYNNEYRSMNSLKEKYAQPKCDSTRKFITLLKKVTEISFEPCQAFEVRDLMDSISRNYGVVNDLCKKKNNAELKADSKDVDRLSRLLIEFNLENETFKSRLKYPPHKDCNDLSKAIKDYTRLLNSCIDGGGKCKVYIAEFKKAGDDINELINKWQINQLRKHDDFEEIITKTDSDIEKARLSCQNSKKITDAIKDYEKIKEAYNKITKYSK